MGKKEFHSNGKLLITGEYLVLQGALALAVPLKFGQDLTVEEFHDERPMIHWRTWIQDQPWFEAEFSTPFFKILGTSDAVVANKLSEYFMAMASLNPNFIDSTKYYQAQSRLNFDIRWGLGSSSSLISNLADWAGIDPFELHQQVSSGSGYDIAASSSNKALLYKKTGKTDPEVKKVDFNPPFRENIWFVYSGKKQDSEKSIQKFLEQKKDYTTGINEIDQITREMLKCTDLELFNELIASHEKILSGILKMKPVKKSGFSDFDGQVKSLGAWGGDFLLFTWKNSREDLKEYLAKKNIHHFFSFDEIIKHEE